MPAPLSGGCLCGAIRYTVSVPITELRACHCRDCQKSTGGAGTVNAVIPSAAMQIGKGTPKRYSVTADSGRTLHRFFCGDAFQPARAHAGEHRLAHRHARRFLGHEDHRPHLDPQRAPLGLYRSGVPAIPRAARRAGEEVGFSDHNLTPGFNTRAVTSCG
jgi:hypothetical protein